MQLLSATVAGSFENSFAGASVYAAEHAHRRAKIAGRVDRLVRRAPNDVRVALALHSSVQILTVWEP